MNIKINYKYLLVFLILLITEVLIALYVRDTIIRPFVGDILVVILMYTFIKSFIKSKIKYLSIYLFIFATCIEIFQYFNLVERLNLLDNKVLSIILGSTFDLMDIVCYFIGTVILILFEMCFNNSNR